MAPPLRSMLGSIQEVVEMAVRKQDYAMGTGGTFSGRTKGSKGVSTINGSLKQSASTTRKAVRDVGWPGNHDSRSESSDRQQSAY